MKPIQKLNNLRLTPLVKKKLRHTAGAFKNTHPIMGIIYTTTFIKSQHFLVERFSSCCIFRSSPRSPFLRLSPFSHPPTRLPKFFFLIFSFLSPNPFLPHFLFLFLFLFLFSLPFFRLPFHRSEYKKTKAAAAAFVSVRKIIFSLPNRF